MSKYINDSEKLEQIWQWVQANDNPLSIAYESACATAGHTQYHDAEEGQTEYGKYMSQHMDNKGRLQKLDAIQNRAYELRDMLGKIILSIIST